MIKKYDDFIKRGADHKIYNIDDDWLLKMPRTDFDKDTKKAIKDFDEHIKFMKKYPEIFVKVKKLDNYRASVEKVDIDLAEQEIKHVYKLIWDKVELYDELVSYGYKKLVGVLYNDNTPTNNEIITEILYNLDKYAHEHNDKIVKKWHDFIIKLKKTFGTMYLEDLFPRNMGIDKNGNIKLVDY